MSLPSYSDLKLWVGTLFSRQDWDYNFKKIVDWFSDGSADLVVGSIKAPNGIDMDGGKITNIGAATSGSDAVNLDTAQTLLNRSSYYYLFSVASGKEDNNGDSAFLQKDSDVQVTVLAGGVNPDLVICQSDGTTESLTSNTVLTIAAADDTYYIVKEKGQAPVVTSGKVDIGKVLPTSDITAGDYFLDNSTIPFKGYKYDAVSGWVETPFCLLGTVEKVSGTATCTPVSYNDNQFDMNIYNMVAVPVGMVIACPATTIPEKFLECDGSSLLRSQYKSLFDVIGTTYGNVDETHFNLPNFQGAFLRGAGSQSLGGRTFASAAIGTLQDDDVKPHTHTYSGFGTGGLGYQGGPLETLGGSGNTGSYGGTETRPLNHAVKWIIRY